jgi:hypothetical protein
MFWKLGPGVFLQHPSTSQQTTGLVVRCYSLSVSGGLKGE